MGLRFLTTLILAAVAASFPAACRAPTPKPRADVVTTVDVPAEVRAAVAAKDRTQADRALDPGRHPAETLAFFGIAPGMRVADLGAGGGYTTELLARVVGPKGTVYGHNSPFILERFAAKPWKERLARRVNRNVQRVDSDFDQPLPPDVHDLDAVVMILFYHDTVWMGADRAHMNAAIFRALKPGGVYGIVDHSARAGTRMDDVKTLHRIEERVVRDEVEEAGFKLVAEATFLHNPEDTRDWNDSPTAAGPRRGTSDRFVLKFVKPLPAATPSATR